MLLSRRLWRLYRFYNRLVYLDIFIRVSIKFIGTKIRIYSNKKNSHSRGCLSVGVTGFEPATLCSQSRCATFFQVHLQGSIRNWLTATYKQIFLYLTLPIFLWFKHQFKQRLVNTINELSLILKSNISNIYIDVQITFSIFSYHNRKSNESISIVLLYS